MKTEQVKPVRTLKVLKIGCWNWTIQLDMPKKSAKYSVTAVTSALVHWQEEGTDEHYFVENGKCNCKGNVNHGHCKHVDATKKLVSLGVIK
jgi:hypothetical protein